MTGEKNGATVYGRLFLFLYDFVILFISNSFIWCCPTGRVQLPLFRAAVGEKHIDIGVGTGYYPAKALPQSPCKEVTLVDLNALPLATAARRVRSACPQITVQAVEADATMPPLPTPGAPATAAAALVPVRDRQTPVVGTASGASQALAPTRSGYYDSASAFFLLHCIPGPHERKARVFEAVAEVLSDQGVFVGTTILGTSGTQMRPVQAPMNSAGRVLMALYNRSKIFHNEQDNLAEFEASLKNSFAEVEVWTVGMVMLFRARAPRRAAKLGGGSGQ